ncbi:hypothetical protein CK501_07310 [Halovibrio salipaludis]|uniref:Uncharacterized protein n=1 Tax=Halovibrio salipaludis TaxID=2032626 RepID=A0A2A2F9W8_9GAMM|nr:hypothetical protein [Halovibrio salipaludis]PAU81343.1 hypothetical protein CK501_07310 [Halovibrio salipaludis]
MAQHQPERPEEPRVHPGGRLEPVPEPETPAEDPSVVSGSPGNGPDGEPSGGREASADADPEAAHRAAREAERKRQQRRRKLLHDCERLLLLDFDTLAMPGWPDHHQLHLARRRRDSWLLLLSVLAVVVLAGMGNLVPALIGGVAFGALALAALWGLPGVRHVFTHQASHMELLLKRRRLLHRARKHVEHLEGPIGLAAACRPLAEYNPALRRSRYTSLYNLSERGQLVDSIRNRSQAQLYLIFALEAEKAYNRLREEYLRTHEQMLDEGDAEPLDAAARASDPGVVPVPESDPGPDSQESGAAGGDSVTAHSP